MIPLPNLLTVRLKLRPFSIEEAPAVAKLVNDPLVTRDLRTLECPYTVQDARDWLVQLPAEWDEGRSAVFGIELREPLQADGTKPWPAGILVGSIGMLLNGKNSRGELGYWLGRDFWGNGFCSEAATAVLDFAFTNLGLHKVTSECLARNPASARVLEKVGFDQEGLLKQHFRKTELETFSDVQVFGLLRETWNERA